MTARDYLEKYKEAQHRADLLREKYDAIIGTFDAAGSTDYIGVRRAGINKPTERKVERAAAALEKWRRAQLDALEIRQDTYALLEALPCHECDVMVRRYVWLETWPQIEQGTGYTHSAVFRIHRRALQLVQEYIDSGYLDEIRSDLDSYIKRRVNVYYH